MEYAIGNGRLGKIGSFYLIQKMLRDRDLNKNDIGTNNKVVNRFLWSDEMNT